jgi:hypothetical protein
MNTEGKEISLPQCPDLWIPGWAIRVHVELLVTEGVDALQHAVLGLINADVPGVPGSLARHLSVEERIVEMVLLRLADAGLVEQSEESVWRLTDKDANEDEVERREGWVFWDPIRARLLPELFLVNGNHGLPILKRESEGHEAPRRDKPHFEDIRRDLIPITLSEQFAIRGLKRSSGEWVLAQVDRESLLRICLTENRGDRVEFPLLVPFDVEPVLGDMPSVYFKEPVYSRQLAMGSPFSPYLMHMLEKEVPKGFQSVVAHAQEVNTDFLVRNNAAILSKFGGIENLEAQAEAEIRSALGWTFGAGPFADKDLVRTARYAEVARLAISSLGQAVDTRRSYAYVLQILGRLLADEIQRDWTSSPAAKGASAHLKSTYGLHNDEKKRLQNTWRDFVRQFDRRNGTSFGKWETGIPGDYRAYAINPKQDWRLSQLGSVMRAWGALAMVSDQEDTGRFHLCWIREAHREVPGLFQLFEETKEQRNEDKVGSFIEMPANLYRRNVYAIWRALAIGHERAMKSVSR